MKKDARTELCALQEGAEWQEQGEPSRPSKGEILSLYGHMRKLTDCRMARGIRYPVATLVSIAVMAKMAWYRGYDAIGEFAAKLDQDTLRDLHSFYSHRLDRYTAPRANAFAYFLKRLPPEALDQALRGWAGQEARDAKAVAMDGKVVRGASRQRVRDGGSSIILFAAVTHGDCVPLGQKQVDEKSNGIPAMHKLVDELELKGKVVTADALHTRKETAQAIRDAGADHVLIVKDNQPTMRDDLKEVNWNAAEIAESECHTKEKGHGRIEHRRGRTVDLQGAQWAASPICRDTVRECA